MVNVHHGGENNSAVELYLFQSHQMWSAHCFGLMFCVLGMGWGLLLAIHMTRELSVLNANSSERDKYRGSR